MTEEPLEIKSLTTLEGAEEFVSTLEKLPGLIQEALNFVREGAAKSDCDFVEREVIGRMQAINTLISFAHMIYVAREASGIDDIIRENAATLPAHTLASIERNKDFPTCFRSAFAAMGGHMARALPNLLLKAEQILPTGIDEMRIFRSGVEELYGKDEIYVIPSSVTAIEIQKLASIFGTHVEKEREI